MKGSLLEIHSFIDQGQVDLRNGDLKGTKLHKFFKQLRTILAKLNSQFNFVNQSCLNYKNQLYRLYQQFNGPAKDSKIIHSKTNNFASNTNHVQYDKSRQPQYQKGQEQYGLHLPVNSRSGQSRQKKRDNHHEQRTTQNYQNRSIDRDPSPLRIRTSALNSKGINYGSNQHPLTQNDSPYFENKKNDAVRESRLLNTRNRFSSVDKENFNNFGNSSTARNSKAWKVSPARLSTLLFSKNLKGLQNQKRQSCNAMKSPKNHAPMHHCNCQVNDVVNQVRQIKEQIDNMQNYCRKSMINENQTSPRQMPKKVTKVYGLSREKTADQLQILKKQMDSYIETILSSKKKAVDYLDKNIKKIRDRQERLPALGKLTNNQYMMQ